MHLVPLALGICRIVTMAMKRASASANASASVSECGEKQWRSEWRKEQIAESRQLRAKSYTPMGDDPHGDVSVPF